MTPMLYIQWLKAFNIKMEAHKRKVTLFTDHCPVHSLVKLWNSELILPANNTTIKHHTSASKGWMHCGKQSYHVPSLSLNQSASVGYCSFACRLSVFGILRRLYSITQLGTLISITLIRQLVRRGMKRKMYENEEENGKDKAQEKDENEDIQP